MARGRTAHTAKPGAEAAVAARLHAARGKHPLVAFADALREANEGVKALGGLEASASIQEMREELTELVRSTTEALTKVLSHTWPEEDENGFDETNNPDYDNGLMGKPARDLNALADDLGYTSFEQVKAVLERGAPNTARDKPARATAEPRPETTLAASPEPAAALAWPDKKWKDSSEKILGKKLGIVTFLEREWEPFIQKSGQVVTRDILAMHDPDAEEAFMRHLERHKFPKGVSIIYPKYLAKIASERPELVRAALGRNGIAGMRL